MIFDNHNYYILKFYFIINSNISDPIQVSSFLFNMNYYVNNYSRTTNQI